MICCVNVLCCYPCLMLYVLSISMPWATRDCTLIYLRFCLCVFLPFFLPRALHNLDLFQALASRSTEVTSTFSLISWNNIAVDHLFLHFTWFCVSCCLAIADHGSCGSKRNISYCRWDCARRQFAELRTMTRRALVMRGDFVFSKTLNSPVDYLFPVEVQGACEELAILFLCLLFMCVNASLIRGGLFFSG